MPCYMLSHLADATLARDLADVVARERAGTAQVLAHIAEFDARRLYLPAGYPSMFAYCVGALRLSEDAAAKRIQAARTARRFPALFAALAEGRLHLTGVGLLSPYLIEETAEELLSAATHKTKAEIEGLLARRFPRPDVLAWVTALPGGGPDGSEHAPAHVGSSSPNGQGPGEQGREHAPAHVGSSSPSGQGPGEQGREHAPAHVEPPAPAGAASRLKPLSSQSFAVQFTLSREGHDLLRQAQALLGHEVAAGDIGAVVERGLGLLVRQLERRKFAATATPATRHRRARLDGRHIPAHVRRAVWARDGGRCTFVGDSGHRCEARSRLEFDHVQPFARGGEATVAGLRLRCRAHNQFEAERVYGEELMREKRLAAADGRAAGHVEEVVPWLRRLGFGATEARQAAARCEAMPDAPLEARVIEALRHVRVRGTRTEPAPSRTEGVPRGPRPEPATDVPRGPQTAAAADAVMRCRSVPAGAGR